jgi:hypothetical protein
MWVANKHENDEEADKLRLVGSLFWGSGAGCRRLEGVAKARRADRQHPGVPGRSSGDASASWQHRVEHRPARMPPSHAVATIV